MHIADHHQSTLISHLRALSEQTEVVFSFTTAGLPSSSESPLLPPPPPYEDNDDISNPYLGIEQLALSLEIECMAEEVYSFTYPLGNNNLAVELSGQDLMHHPTSLEASHLAFRDPFAEVTTLSHTSSTDSGRASPLTSWFQVPTPMTTPHSALFEARRLTSPAFHPRQEPSMSHSWSELVIDSSQNRLSSRLALPDQEDHHGFSLGPVSSTSSTVARPSPSTSPTARRTDTTTTTTTLPNVLINREVLSRESSVPSASASASASSSRNLSQATGNKNRRAKRKAKVGELYSTGTMKRQAQPKPYDKMVKKYRLKI